MFFSKSSLILHWSIIEIIFLEKDTGLTPLRHAIMIRWLSNGKVNSVSFSLSVYVYLTSPKSSSHSLFKTMYCGGVNNIIVSPQLIHYQYIYPIDRIFH